MAGSCRRKRRKKLAKAWKEFQTEHELTDAEVKLARSAGYPLDRFLEKLATEAYCELPVREAISMIRLHREKELAGRRDSAVKESLKTKVKKKKGLKHDPQWVKAKKLCRLNQDDICKAKELGLNPKSLIKNIPSPQQQWKLSVKHWIGELYEKRFPDKVARSQKKKRRRGQPMDVPVQFEYTTPFGAYLAGDFEALHALECERDAIDLATGIPLPDQEPTDDIPF